MTPEEFDSAHLWHPYSNIAAPGPAHLVARAQGSKLVLADGAELIDGMSSWWSVIHGYSHPKIVGAIQKQAATLSHVMFGGLTHHPAIELGELLLKIAPPGLDKIFYADSGSVSVEVAMKMAVQHQHALGRPERTRFATIRSGYHGDTWKAMSVCDPVTGMHHLFKGALSPQFFAPQPPVQFGAAWPNDPDKNGLAALESLFESHGPEIAALILEPVVQGAGGMYFYHPQYLNHAREICDAHGALLIFDEIATGFGRTGAMLALEHTNITPDILCLGKAITGGMMSFAATIASSKVAQTIGEGAPGVFMHGPTFMANPLACAAAKASLEILGEGDWRMQTAQIERLLAQSLAPARKLPNVRDVRVLGAIGVIEMKHNVNPEDAHRRCKELGVWLRPFGRNIYCMPPYVISALELEKLGHAMVALAAEL